MELLESLHTRRSIRRFTAECIRDEQLEELVEAAASAPSAGNRQPWAFGVVREAEKLKRLRAVSPGISGTAAALIAICLDKRRFDQDPDSGAYEMALLSLGAAMENLLLAAHDQGLGSCAIGSFHAASVSSLLGLPQHLVPKLLVIVGHAAEQPEPPGRRAMDEICFRDGLEAR